MRNYILLIFQCFWMLPAFSQQAQNLDARGISLSGTDACYFGTWTASQNPAALALKPWMVLGINYHNRFLIPELGSQSVFGVLNFHGFWGYSLNYFGTHAFNTSSFSVAYGQKIFHWLNAGINLKGHRFAVEALKERSYGITGDVGLLFKPGNDVLIGLHLLNPNRSDFNGTEGEYIPAEVDLGIAWYRESDFYLSAQFHWLDYSEWHLSLGAEYRIVKLLAVRMGVKMGNVKSYSFGLACHQKKIGIDIGFEQHTCLGMSSAITATYNFSGNVD